jgi:hypothetical protein
MNKVESALEMINEIIEITNNMTNIAENMDMEDMLSPNSSNIEPYVDFDDTFIIDVALYIRKYNKVTDKQYQAILNIYNTYV